MSTHDLSSEHDQMAFFAKNWSRVQPAVYNYVLSIVRRHNDVDDVVQEVAVTVCKDLHRYNPDLEFLPWVLSIARFRAIDHLRKHGRDKLVLSSDLLESLENPIADASLADNERKSALTKCVKRLQPRAANIIRLRYASGMAVKDIAARLNTTPNAISILLNRSRSALYECISRRLKEAE